MAGLYIHIPFCKSRCIYCGFYSTVQRDLCSDYVDALCCELELRRGYFEEGAVVYGSFDYEPWRTVYIGGGTPSLLDGNMLSRLFGSIDCSKAVEVTMECNPDDVTQEYADMISCLPVNRVSMGAQTFSDSRLRFLGRRHSAGDVALAVERLRKAGIGNISIDLMYGFPDETLDEWQCDIDMALSLDVEHISAYSLMMEEDTPLYDMLMQGKVSEADDELSLKMYETLMDRLYDAGYEHYEISNFARKGYRSQHNSSYWNATPYMGIGASAHSYNGISRQWNVDDVEAYIRSISEGLVPMEIENLSKESRYNDFVMLSLRTPEGIDIERMRKEFGEEWVKYCMDNARGFIRVSGYLRVDGNRLVLTRKGLFVSDMVMSMLMKI
ncbi:radical SAM family heme chaperone HemW [Xylanibacter muris]|uniref:Heme chaperone HemW n=1 Tax=Xylanibacter muris TaxID=2736290 RepID=A0ABX2AQA7_9BACT|nr:radical SAM family heme chaperone HemW [Xylanibacter muris]NPD93159.1 radical SAM family heme chaperone HemW [Xylanibacter muris]